MSRPDRSTDHSQAYRGILSRRSPEQRRQLAQVKRFMERLVGDDRFRDALRDAAPDYKRVAEALGLSVDPAEMLPLFSREHLRWRHSEREAEWPLSKLWSDYINEMRGHRDLVRSAGDTETANPVFHAWRQRQIRRSDSELGASASAIVHPIVAFELSDGCSVGCWFCGISAERFKGAWPYDAANAALWQGVLEVTVEQFGRAAQTGFCYWATDPMDNPDYDRFIDDYWRITGYLPQTTTAAPLKDVELTRRVLKLFDEKGCITNRFSIVNRRMLERVHETFSPDELMGVELVTQNKESLTVKASAGRARERQKQLLAAGKDGKLALLEADHSTIACVSGLLVSLPKREVSLVAPTRSTDERWPLGYRVWETAGFEDVEGFRAAVRGLVERHCAATLKGSDRLAFRPDLSFRATAEGFELANSLVVHSFHRRPFLRELGQLVAEGRHTAGEVHADLLARGADPFLLADCLRMLHEEGVLDDDPVFGGIGRVEQRSPLAAAG